jgi:hypothetical protein
VSRLQITRLRLQVRQARSRAAQRWRHLLEEPRQRRPEAGTGDLRHTKPR